MRRSQLKRTEFKRKLESLNRSRLRRAGKKVRRWAKVRRGLKTTFSALNITTCELRFENCTPDNFLTWAHGRKRRLLKEGELESFLCLACQNCHRVLDEVMSHDEMAETVSRVISERMVTV